MMRLAGMMAPGSGTGPVGHASMRFMPLRIAARSVNESFCERVRPKSMRIVESVDLIFPFVAESNAALYEAESEACGAETLPLAESAFVESLPPACWALDPPQAATATASARDECRNTRGRMIFSFKFGWVIPLSKGSRCATAPKASLTRSPGPGARLVNLVRRGHRDLAEWQRRAV